MKRKYALGLLMITFCSTMLSAVQATMQPGQWTSSYQKIFSPSEIDGNSRKQHIVFLKNNVLPFGQLVFSWNAFRPRAGYFSFFTQARDIQTKRWGAWHKMMEWGADVQRSFMNVKTKNDHTKYLYVRLETNRSTLSDAFRIKIVSHEGANLGLVKSFSVCLSDFKKFRSESIGEMVLRLPSVYIKNVPKLSQFMIEHERNRGMCSPTSMTMLVEYLTNQKIDPMDFAEMAFDRGLNAYGSWPFNMAHAFERSSGSYWFAMERLHSFKSLYKHLLTGIPVVVSVRGKIKGAAKDYNSGHLLVVVGWDVRNKRVICHDPAFATENETVRGYSIEDFLAAWERSHRLAYIARPVVSHL